MELWNSIFLFGGFFVIVIIIGYFKKIKPNRDKRKKENENKKNNGKN